MTRIRQSNAFGQAPEQQCDELCTNLGDGMDQAADISLFATSIPSWNFTPRTILGN